MPQTSRCRPTAYPRFVFALASVLLCQPYAHGRQHEELDSLQEMALQDLLSLEVTSVSRREQSLLTAPAAIHVVTSDELQRRGVKSIPEALRLVPGLYVAQLDANKWVVSSRGFAGRFANKLLVQIDGRSVYTPSFSGVYWDMQDPLISDIDRIEVIRGPGAALWGANAVNGIINIITKPVANTQGGQVELGAGDQLQQHASLRYGAALSDKVTGRMHVQQKQYRSNNLRLSGEEADAEAFDGWQPTSGGFRLDGVASEAVNWTLQGDLFQADEKQYVQVLWQPPLGYTSVKDEFSAKGGNLLGKLDFTHANQSHSTLTTYWDRAERQEVYVGQQHDIQDIDFQNQLADMGAHRLIWGLGYRHVDSDFRSSFAASLPAQRNNIYSMFVQDEIALLPERLALTLGSKFEHNTFTGFEYQPSARLMWMPTPGHSLWTSVSRAVRTPSMVERDSQIITGINPALSMPAFVRLYGNAAFQSEELLAYELGHRYYGNRQFSLDTALFLNDYDRYQSMEAVSSTALIHGNELYGKSYGLEMAAVWQAQSWWQLKATYSLVKIDMRQRDGSSDPASVEVIEKGTPKHLASFYSAMDIQSDWKLDTWVSYVDDVPNPGAIVLSSMPIDAYFLLNARLAWQFNPDLELGLTVNNLLDDRHVEYVGEFLAAPSEMERSLFAELRWSF